MIGHHSRLRDMMGQSYPIYACTRANLAHYSSIYSSSKHTLLKHYLGRNLTGIESVDHIEQYHIKSGNIPHNLKQRGHKAFVELLFLWS